MNKTSTYIYIILISLLVISCSKDTSGIDQNTNHFEALTVEGATPGILVESDENRIFIFESRVNGRMLIYNYESRTLESSIEKPSNFLGTLIGIDDYNSSKEIYTHFEKAIKIYSAEDLSLIDEIDLFGGGDQIRIETPVYVKPGLFFVPIGTLDNPIFSFDRSTLQMLSSSRFTGHAMLIKAFRENPNGNILVAGINRFSSRSNIYITEFDPEGVYIDSSEKAKFRGSGGKNIVSVRDFENFFIAGSSIVTTGDLSEIGLLSPDIKEAIIGSQFIYSINESTTVTKYDKSDLTSLGTTEVSSEVFKSFIDDGHLVLIHLLQEGNNQVKINITRLNEADL